MAANVVIVLTLVSVSGSSVKKDVSYYSCCDPVIKFDPSSENTWSKAGKNFAHIDGDKKTCISPCQAIKDDQMYLDACVNVTLATFTTMNIIKETRKDYLGRECTHRLFSGASCGLQSSELLLMAAAGWLLLHII